MNILVVHPYLSILGGGERVCLHVIKALVEDGHHVTLVSELIKPEKLESFIGFNVLDDVAHVSYKKFEPKVRKFSVYQRMLHHSLSRQGAKKKIGRVDIELLTQDVAFTIGVGKKKLAYVHFPEFLAHLETAKPKLKWFWEAYYAPIRYYWRRQIDMINLFLCNSKFTKGKIEEKWGKVSEVVYPPVDIKMFKPNAKRGIVVTVGRFVPSKNYELLLEVAKRLRDVEFEVIGIKQDSDYYEKIASSKPKNVTLFTDLTQEEVVLHLGRAKVYLHTMVNEHFGISIVEAMASGCVPIVHNSGGGIEAIGSLGYTYNTVEECIDNITTALNTDIDIAKFIERAKMFGSERFEKDVRMLI